MNNASIQLSFDDAKVKVQKNPWAVKHGGYESLEYSSWKGMKQRTTNPKNPEFKNYGGRGIKLCPEWHNFKAFIRDMGPKPTPLHSIDRINPDGDYEPGNCRWATPKEQSANRRDNPKITFRGETKTRVEWARELGISGDAIRHRLKVGETVEQALSRPSLRPPKSKP